MIADILGEPKSTSDEILIDFWESVFTRESCYTPSMVY